MDIPGMIKTIMNRLTTICIGALIGVILSVFAMIIIFIFVNIYTSNTNKILEISNIFFVITYTNINPKVEITDFFTVCLATVCGIINLIFKIIREKVKSHLS